MRRLVLLLLVFISTRLTAQPFERIAHRGGSALMPENSIGAMRNALDFHVGLEMDAYLSKDKQVFIYHDDVISPKFASNPDGSPVSKEQASLKKIIDFTYEELTKYDLGLRRHPDFPRRKIVSTRIPLLTALIDSVEAYAKVGTLKEPTYSIEMKVPNATLPAAYRQNLVDAAIAIIVEKNIQKRVIIQSFDIEVLEYLHKKYPNMQTAFLISQTPEDYLGNLRKISFKPTAYSPPYKSVTPAMVAYCHQQNIQVVTWTVNDPAEITRLKNMGVDAVMSDYPDYFLPY